MTCPSGVNWGWLVLAGPCWTGSVLREPLIFLLGPSGQRWHVLLMAMAGAEECKRRYARHLEAWAQNWHLSLPPHSVSQRTSHGLVWIQRYAPAKLYEASHEHREHWGIASVSALWHKQCDRISVLDLLAIVWRVLLVHTFESRLGTLTKMWYRHFFQKYQFVSAIRGFHWWQCYFPSRPTVFIVGLAIHTDFIIIKIICKILFTQP